MPIKSHLGFHIPESPRGSRKMPLSPQFPRGLPKKRMTLHNMLPRCLSFLCLWQYLQQCLFFYISEGICDDASPSYASEGVCNKASSSYICGGLQRWLSFACLWGGPQYLCYLSLRFSSMTSLHHLHLQRSVLMALLCLPLWRFLRTPLNRLPLRGSRRMPLTPNCECTSGRLPESQHSEFLLCLECASSHPPKLCLMCRPTPCHPPELCALSRQVPHLPSKTFWFRHFVFLLLKAFSDLSILCFPVLILQLNCFPFFLPSQCSLWFANVLWEIWGARSLSVFCATFWVLVSCPPSWFPCTPTWVR